MFDTRNLVSFFSFNVCLLFFFFFVFCFFFCRHHQNSSCLFLPTHVYASTSRAKTFPTNKKSLLIVVELVCYPIETKAMVRIGWRFDKIKKYL